jgi:hypothetical protein
MAQLTVIVLTLLPRRLRRRGACREDGVAVHVDAVVGDSAIAEAEGVDAREGDPRPVVLRVGDGGGGVGGHGRVPDRRLVSDVAERVGG